MSKSRWSKLNQEIKRCQRCPRLIDHCQNIAQTKRKAYRTFRYWGKPVPNFGPHQSQLLIVGLAPGAHGANRTGRMFTGDRSGDWLFRALHRAGFASQPTAETRRDGLKLIDASITAVCHCAPPDNKPTRDEIDHCQPFLAETFKISDPIVIVALGSLAWTATIKMLVELEWMDRPKKRPPFSHAVAHQTDSGRWLLGSYHPSQQNTFTGRLTEPMLDDVFKKARKIIDRGLNQT